MSGKLQQTALIHRSRINSLLFAIKLLGNVFKLGANILKVIQINVTFYCVLIESKHSAVICNTEEYNIIIRWYLVSLILT